MFNAPRVEISSTEVRKRMGEGKPVDFLVGKDVAEYLTSMKS
jgi:nicotinic acid mononucleotide adenylyltransferase